MKTSTPQQPKPRQKTAILLMGAPGSRKTTLMLQLPNLRVIDCDQNLDGPEDSVRRYYDKDLSYAYEQVASNDDGSMRDAGQCYNQVVTLLGQPQDGIEWNGLDGLSAINEYIIRKIMADQRCSELEARHWSTFKSLAYTVLFAKLRHCGTNVIVTAHSEEQTRNDPKLVMTKVTTGYLPYIQGSIQQQVAGLFTDVWYIETQPGVAGKMDTTLYTDKLPLYKDLKNSLNLPAVIKDPTYAKLHDLSKGLI